MPPTTTRITTPEQALAYLRANFPVPMARAEVEIPPMVLQSILTEGGAVINDGYLDLAPAPKQAASMVIRGHAVRITVNSALQYQWIVLKSGRVWLWGLTTKGPTVAIDAAEKAIIEAEKQRRTTTVNQQRR